MTWRVALVIWLTVALSLLALNTSKAQFNGCSAGFCILPSGIVSSATNSLIFTSASSQSLSATGKVGINQQKSTVNLWWKNTATGATQVFYYSGDGTATNELTLRLLGAGIVQVLGSTASTTVVNLQTTATFTDTTTWHNLHVAFDTTQATAANRVQIYVDGTLITAFGTATYPAQNANLSNNFAATYRIGSNQVPANFANMKMAMFYYIDGQQLTPTSFITGTPGVPKTYSGTYTGTFDFFLSFSNGTSTATLGADSSGEGNNWTLNNMTTANQSTDHP
jgi:hypothetical protein